MTLTPAPAHAQRGGADAASAQIEARTRREMSALLAERQTRTPAQRKMDSHLLDTARVERGEPVAPGIAKLSGTAGALRRDMAGRVCVTIRVETVDAATLSTVRGAGGKIVYGRVGANSIVAWLPLQAIEPLMARDGFLHIKPADKPIRRSVTSEGDRVLKADVARTTYSVNGAGVKVGVISDSIKFIEDAQALGELPANVTVLPGLSGLDQPDNSGEGTAMLEIVHDLAPGASLYFATAGASPDAFGDNIRALRAAGCDIIVDDIGFPSQNPFGDDVVAKAVEDVTAAGAWYFTAAGNDGNATDGTASAWEGNFVASSTTLTDPTSGNSLGVTARFSSTEDFNTFTSGSDEATTVFAFWADPTDEAVADYDLFVVNAATGEITDRGATTTGPGVPPAESVSAPAGSIAYKIYVTRPDGITTASAQRFLHISTFKQKLKYGTPGQVYGHPGSPSAITVAAAPSSVSDGDGPTGPYPNPFTAAQKSEVFTTDGPRRVFFKSDGTEYTPGNRLATGGVLRQKPDVTSADGNLTSRPGDSGFNPFFGTSAAAPHLAAVSALVKQKAPSLTLAQLRSIYTGSAALDIEAPGWDRDTGYGIVMADRALQAVSASGPTVSTLTLNPATVTGGQNSVATVTLSAAAPTGGLALSLNSSNTSAATVPATVTVPQGATAMSFTVTSKTVASAQTSQIKATRGTSFAQAALTVNPAGASKWTPISLAVSRTDGTSRLLWKETTNRYAVWKISATGVVQVGKYYGPVTDYVTDQIVVAPNGETSILWKNSQTKQAALWTLKADLSDFVRFSVYNYAPGYTPQNIAADASSNVRMTWRKSTGSFLVWTITPSNGVITGASQQYGPFANLQDGQMGVGADGNIRLLLKNTATGDQGRVLTIPAAYGAPTANTAFGPLAGASPDGLSVGADNNARVLYTFPSGKITITKLATATGGNGSALATASYGPFTGVTPLSISVGGDNQTRLLWKYTTGKAALWILNDPLTAISATYTYGPIY